MKIAFLKWQNTDEGCRFSVVDSTKTSVPISYWGQFGIQHQGGSGAVGPLLVRHNNNDIAQSETEITLSYKQIASLDNNEIAQLGLPAVAPFRLQVRGKGQLARPNFEINYTLLTVKGKPALGLKRAGAFCKFAGKDYTLLDPLFSLIEGIEEYKSKTFKDIDEQMVSWGKLQKKLPEDAIVDNQLQTVTIIRADRFTLDIHDNNHFSPVLMDAKDDSDDETAQPENVLPDARQGIFSSQFSRRQEARSHYALGSGWYVVVPDSLRKGLQVVREAQTGDSVSRKAFLANPTARLKDKILDIEGTSENDVNIDSLFIETAEFLSARILCLGEWQPKLCAYKLPTKNKWLPEEDMLAVASGEAVYNVQFGDNVITLTDNDIISAVPKIEEAINENKLEIEINGQRIPVNQESLQILNKLRGNISKENEKSVPKDPVKHVGPIVKDNIEDMEYEGALQSARGKAGGLPAVLKTQPLYPHQQKGLDWLQSHWASGSAGALLADDMGLGKTLQALTFLAWISESMDAGDYKRKPFLVIAPTGLLKNWQDEANQHLHSPGLGQIFEAFGAGIKSLNSLSLRQRTQKLTEVDWVLTTYETLRDKISYFLPINWGVAIFDEAQKIKNPVSRMTEMAKSLEVDFTLMMTGTPVENELKDLWCIIDTAIPGYLGSLKDFHHDVEKPAQEDPHIAASLQSKLIESTDPPKMLRRMKEDHIKGLPEKNMRIVSKEMPSGQADKYAQIVQTAIDSQGQPGAMLKALQHLRNCSLFSADIGPEGLTDELINKSARLVGTISLLDDIHAKKEKVLIFLESLKLQELLIPYLQQRYELSHPPICISGKVAGSLRKRYVDVFQKGPANEFDVMILSPKAGGVGLTLTAANHVIHLSRWWNPAVEDQCTDRIFRIGQKKGVTVYYPLAVHPDFGDASFDMNLHALLERKRELSRTVLLPNAITKEDYKDLFGKSVTV